MSRFSLLSWIPFRNPGENKWHLGYNAFVLVREDNPCVDIRQYWVPPGVDESVPTKRGLCFRPAEFAVLIQNWSGIENQLPDLRIVSHVMKRKIT